MARDFAPLVALLLAAMPALAQGQTASRPALTWPKDFNLAAGERVGFIVPVTQPGAVTVSIRWKGAPLNVSLMDASGRPLLPAGAKNAPQATLTYTATKEDLSRGPLWRLIIATEGSRPQPALEAGTLLRRSAPALPSSLATGQVSVAAPPVSREILDRALPTSRRAEPPADRSGRPGPARKNPVLAAYEKAVSDRNAEQEKSVRALHASNLQTERNAQAALRSRMAAEIGKVSPLIPASSVTGIKPRGTLLQPVPPTSTDPTLVQAPVMGYAGDRLVLKGKGLSLVAAQNEVLFTPNASTMVAAVGLSAVQGTDGLVTLQVDVPFSAGNTTPYDGMLFVRVKDRNPVAVTNPLPFRTEALPYISGIAPAETSTKSWLNATGANFKKDDQLHVVLDGGRDLVLTRNSFTPSSMNFYMAEYSADSSAWAQIYVVAKTPTGRMVPGAKFYLKTLPTLAKVNPLPNPQGKGGNLILITGKGFLSPKVEFIPNPGQAASIYGNQAFGAIALVSSTETGVLFKVPYYALLGPLKGSFRLRSTNMATPFDFPYTVEVENTLALIAAPVTMVSFPVGAPGDGDNFWSEMWTSVQNWPDMQTTLKVYHSADWFWGHKADDIFKMTLPLKNGWRYHHVNFLLKLGGAAGQGSDNDPHKLGSDAYLAGSYIDATGALIAIVHWWADPTFSKAWYDLGFYAEGPKGVPYK